MGILYKYKVWLATLLPSMYLVLARGTKDSGQWVDSYISVKLMLNNNTAQQPLLTQAQIMYFFLVCKVMQCENFTNAGLIKAFCSILI